MSDKRVIDSPCYMGSSDSRAGWEECGQLVDMRRQLTGHPQLWGQDLPDLGVAPDSD